MIKYGRRNTQDPGSQNQSLGLVRFFQQKKKKKITAPTEADNNINY